MKLRIPFYLEGSTNPPSYLLRPLFSVPQMPEIQGTLLQKVLSIGQQRARQCLDEMRQERRLDDLARFTFSPPFKEHLLQLKFEFRRRTAHCRLLVVTWESLGQKLAYSPTVGDLWFPCPTSNLEGAAGEALGLWLRQREREGSEEEPEFYSISGKAWVHYLELDLPAPGLARKPPQRSLLALLGGQETLSGSQELARVGRQLERLVQEKPEAFLGRQAELGELARWSSLPGRTCLLVVGPRLVGKTSLLRAHVLAEMHKSKSEEGKKRRRTQYWYLSPGRLISGMSYLGQWENRLLSILRHCRKHNHVLVFDDLVGLLTAGISRDSCLSVAHLLRAFLDRGELRVLGEMTPEAYQVLRERDRALADHFQVLFLQPSDGPLTRRIALAAARTAEESQECQISLEAVLAALQVGQRYLTDASHPGKVSRLLQQVAAHHRQRPVSQDDLLGWFSQHSGLSTRLLDARETLTPQQVEEGLRQQLVGQGQAVKACVEVVMQAKARVQAGHRPLASLLLIGPTGVGKTECARALAQYLFGSEERLIRIDMNEFLGPDSVDRLIGTFLRPDGLLTEAVRGQPFSVVLLDEVEKADPQVLLLLLQILGDGRLSDARGRVVDFSQTIVVMTSNLGADQTQRQLGVRTRRQQEELVYRRAAEEFFPPELFNRIDRIVPFARLDRATLTRVADRLWARLLLREGLRRRQCLLDIDPVAREKVVEAGFHPLLGARALKRMIEEKVVGPVARRLAALPPDGLTLIQIHGELQVTVEPLAAVQVGTVQRLSLNELEDQRRELEAEIGRRLGDGHSVYDADRLQDEEVLFLELRDEVRSLRVRQTSPRPARPLRNPAPLLTQVGGEGVRTLLASTDVLGEWEKLLPQMSHDLAQAEATEMQLRLAFVRFRMTAAWESTPVRLSGHAPSLKLLTRIYQEQLGRVDLKWSPSGVEGPGAGAIMGGEAGLHLFMDRQALHMVWLHAGQPSLKLVRIYRLEGGTLDLASGWMTAKGCPLASFVRARL